MKKRTQWMKNSRTSAYLSSSLKPPNTRPTNNNNNNTIFLFHNSFFSPLKECSRNREIINKCFVVSGWFSVKRCDLFILARSEVKEIINTPLRGLCLGSRCKIKTATPTQWFDYVWTKCPLVCVYVYVMKWLHNTVVAFKNIYAAS